MGANNGKQYGSEGEWAAAPRTPRSTRPFPSPSGLGRQVLAHCPGAHPSDTLSAPSPSLLALGAQAPRGCSPGVGVPLNNFPGCLRDGSSYLAGLFLNACASASLPWAFGV